MVLGGTLGVAGGLLAGLWVSTPWATLIGTALAAVSTVATGYSRRWLEQRFELQKALPRHIAVQDRGGSLPRVRDVTDPLLLGVHPVERLNHPDGSLTPYIPRDIDEELRTAIDQHGLIIVIGESTAGKSRAAFEAIRSRAPDHLLAVPSGRESLSAITSLLSESRRSILWLDDLERFLGPGGLTPAMVADLTSRTRNKIVIVATMRISEYERFTPRAEALADDERRSIWRTSRDVLRGAHTVVTMRRRWSPTELAAAVAFTDDSRIAYAVRRAELFGVAETLAAGPELLRDWQNGWAPGNHPRGAALVAAAVDCRRAGLDEPVPATLLVDLHHYYLDARGGQSLRPESMDDAWTWAMRPVHGASSLLMPVGPTSAEQRYLAFDYLIDQPDNAPIPSSVWATLIAGTDRTKASWVANQAYWRVRPAFHAAVDSGIADSPFARSQALADRGEYSAAIEVLRDSANLAANPDERSSMRHQIALYRMLSDNVEEAETSFKELLAEAESERPPDDEILQIIRHNIASCARRRGDLSDALAQFQRILADRERYLGADAMNTLATRSTIAQILAEMGNPAEALRLTKQVLADEEGALGPDHTNALETRHTMAKLLASNGDLDAAIDVLRTLLPNLIRALGPDHADVLAARWNLARYHGQNGDRSEALRLFHEVLADRERIHGPDSEHFASARQEFDDFLAQS